MDIKTLETASPFVRRVLAAAAMVFILYGCAKSPEELLAAARAKAAAGDTAAAVLLLKDGLQQDPDNGAMRLLLGTLYVAVRDGVSAEKELRAASAAGAATDGAWHLALARALHYQDDLVRLIKECDPTAADTPAQRASLLALRGLAEYGIGKRDAALGTLVEAEAAAADNPDVMLLQARLKIAAGRLDDALGVVSQLNEKYPDYQDGWRYLAVVNELLGRPDDALVGFDRLIARAQNDVWALLGRARMLLRKGELEAAAQAADHARKAQPGFALAHAQYGVVMLAGDDFRAALDAAQEGLQRAPDEAQALLVAGLASRALGTHEQAKQYLGRALAKLPKHGLARRALARVNVDLGDYAAAWEVIAPAAAQSNPEPESLALAGEVLFRLGEREQAMQLLGRAVEAAPESPRTRIAWALAQMGSGNTDLGLAELETAVTTTDTATAADELLVMSLLARSAVDQAWEAVQSLKSRDPEAPLTHNLTGIVLAARGDIAAARTAFEAALAADPENLPALANLAELDRGADDAATADARYATALEQAPGNLALLYAAARHHLAHDDKAGATVLYETAVKRAPDALDARLMLGSLYLAGGNPGQANTLAEETWRKFPSSAQAAALSAKTLLALGRAEAAIERIEKLVTLQPDSPAAPVQVARFKVKAGDAAGAIKTLRDAVDGMPAVAELKLELTALLLAEKRFDEATAFVREVQTTLPEAPLGLLLEGEVHEAQGQLDAALAAYHRAFAAQPSEALAIKLLSTREKAGDAAAAFDELEQFLAANPDAHAVRATLADRLSAAGAFARAVPHYEHVVESGALSTRTLNTLAYADTELGDARAVETAEAALATRPGDAGLLDTLGWILVDGRHDAERGRTLLARAHALAPANPEIAYHFAAALARSGDTAGARERLEALLATASDDFASRGKAEALLKTL
ncbi:MAG: PEP-CTERM system TPR-repeat protein PrsT [Gammaproteobacteria bacterium]